MSDCYETKAPKKTYLAKDGGFVVARLEANPRDRIVIAHGFVDGVNVASASAADNSLPGVISIPTQSFTMPVCKGSKWIVKVQTGSGVEVRWCPVKMLL